MSNVGWVVLLVLGIPLLGLLAWAILAASLVRIAPGRLGLVLVRGRPTDTVLDAGLHFVPALRRRTVAEYVSLEMSYRATIDSVGAATELERAGPAVPVTLGDRAQALVCYVVRFRLVQEQLPVVHNRFGPEGIFPLVRDESARVLSGILGDPAYTVEDLFGSARESCQEQLTKGINDALSGCGIGVVSFHLGAVDLGRTGEVIQATLRARYELEREQAEAATRVARAANDLAMQSEIGAPPSDVAWRYREPELLSDLIHRAQVLNLALRTVGPEGGPAVGQQVEPPPSGPSGG
jgi:regulator of protease activity HflC (stomatin/prohibitin superfamily)